MRLRLDTGSTDCQEERVLRMMDASGNSGAGDRGSESDQTIPSTLTITVAATTSA